MKRPLDDGRIARNAGTLAVAALSDVGMRRSENEDSHVLWTGEDGAEHGAPGTLLVVADGMGGANAGEVASQLAAASVLETWRELGDAGPADALRQAIARANAIVYEQACQNPDQRGMGTTCTAVAIRGERLWFAHVGDSRALLVRGESFQRITRDHSLVAELHERGHLTAEEAAIDPRRNQLTRCVGALPEVEPDVTELTEPLQPGDTVVLCSDGLHGLVTEGEIAMIAGDRAPAEACAELVALANERGGPDNITVLIARVGGAAASVSGESSSPRPGARALVIIAMAVLVLVLGWLLLRSPGGSPPATSPPAAGAPGR